MKRGVHGWRALLVLACLWASPVLASGPTGPLDAASNAAKTRYTRAQTRVGQLRAEQAALEQRITQYKKNGQQPQQLDALLKRSVAAQAVLERAQNALRQAEQGFETTLTASVRSIDAEIRRRVPALRQGSLSDRKKAAAAINDLRAQRQRVRTELATLAKARRKSRAWAKYEVTIEAQDGPGELSDKADFVEDTRDKVIKKRKALAKLLREARQEQQIAQAARDFRTDITLFDEETRQGRVLRQGQGQGRGDVAQNNPSVPPAQSPTDNENSPDPVVRDSFSGSQIPPPSVTSNPGLRAINPDILLNLRVEDLAAGGLDVATLEKYIGDLKALETYLAGQADRLRQRAEALEANETRDLRK